MCSLSTQTFFAGAPSPRNLDQSRIVNLNRFIYLAGFRAPNSFKMRIAGGAWCIAALILTNYYSSVLTSLITVSSPVTIANSVEEVANNDNIKLVILKGFGAAATIAVCHQYFFCTRP